MIQGTLKIMDCQCKEMQLYLFCMFTILEIKRIDIYIFGSSYKKVNTTLQEVSLYKKVG